MAMPAPRTRALARLGGYLNPNDEMDVPPGAPSESEGIRSAQVTPPPAEQQEMQTPEPPNELEAIKEQQRRSVFAADIGRSGAMIAEAISGAKAPMALYDRLEARAGEPLQQYMERLKVNARATHAAPKPGKPQKSTDPNSPESRRAQLLVKATLSDKFTDEEIAQLTEADAENALKYGSLSGQREVTREGHTDANTRASNQIAATKAENALNRSQKWAQIYQAADQFGASQELKERLAMLELAEKQASREDKAAEKAAESSVPGFEPAPGATPVKSDAEALKKSSAAAARMRRGIADLRALHAKYGAFPKGTGANLQQQALRAIQLEAKNIADLGALSGPDFGLMKDMSSEDLNSLPAFLQRTFGGASLEDSLLGLERWMNNTIAGTAEGHGYRPKSSTPQTKQPARAPASSVLPTDASGTPTLDAPAPTTSTSKKYSKSKDTTYVFDASGQLMRTEKGDTRGR